nr:vesicle-associated membrane protein 8 isoform X1 [Kogia breviceps]
MEEATGGGGNDRVRNLQSEVEGVKNIMTQNVERILARGENLDHLRNKTEDLEATSGKHGPGKQFLQFKLGEEEHFPSVPTPVLPWPLLQLQQSSCGQKLWNQGDVSTWSLQPSAPVSALPRSEHFKTTSQKVARKFWWKNVKMIVLICVIVFIIVLFIVLFATGAIP